MSSLPEDILDSVQRLPEAAAKEVLDFARFLLQKDQLQQERDLVNAQQQSLEDWDNDADDVWNDAEAV